MNLKELVQYASTELVLLGLESLANEFTLTPRLNEAYRLFVSEAGNIDDEVEFDVFGGDNEVPYGDWILKFKRVELDGHNLAIVNQSDLDQLGVNHASKPSVFVLGQSHLLGRIYGTPTTSGTLKMSVLRGVKSPLARDRDEPSDVPRAYHTALVDWVVANLLMADGRDQLRLTLMRDRLNRFMSATAAARSERNRQVSKPLRTVSYGGI